MIYGQRKVLVRILPLAGLLRENGSLAVSLNIHYSAVDKRNDKISTTPQGLDTFKINVSLGTPSPRN